MLPPSLDELIAENQPVRIINKVINEIDTKPINRKYKGGGASSYHPRLLLKVLVYGYLNNVYSSRKLEEQTRVNIHFMWLTGYSLRKHKQVVKERLNSEQGIKYRKQRPVDVEPVFAHIKSNHGFKRFLLRGLSKVEEEVGLLSIAQDLRKWTA